MLASVNTQSLVPDDLWEAIEPLLPKEPPKPRGGRPRVPDRAALGGIAFVLRTGCPWRLLPRELGCGSGVTCWRRLRDWQAAGVWEKLHERLLNWLGDEAAIDWSRASLDSVSVRAKRGAKPPAPTRRIAAKPGRSTTWSPIGTGFRWPPGSRPPTPMMRPSCSPWSTPSRRSSALGGDPVVRGSARPSCTRKGRRFGREAPGTAVTRHHPAHRAPRGRVERAAGAAPLGRGAEHRLAAGLPPPRRPLRAAG